MINEFTDISSPQYLPLFLNTGKYIYYMYNINNIIKFNIYDNTNVTNIPFNYVAPRLYNGSENIFILLETKTDRSPVILSIDTDNNIKTYELNRNQTILYPGYANNLIYYLYHSIYIFNNTLFVPLVDIGNGDNLGELYPYVRLFDKDLNVLYDIGFCDLLYDITSDGEKIYILTQSTDRIINTEDS